MAKKPFKVSARTARLIGRENVANADGAIIELVKNCYDADSKICIVYLDIRYDSIPKELGASRYKQFERETTNELGVSFIESAYEKNSSKTNTVYCIKKDTDDNVLSELEYFFKSKNSLYIIDAGEGMTEEVIDNHWMTIGTNNKLDDFITTSGRIKAGAKGIGRFALDRLGSLCNMVTLPIVDKKVSFTGFNWKVDWEDFDGEGVSINQVEAEFEKIENLKYDRHIISLMPDIRVSSIITKNNTEFAKGTLLKVSELRDWWTKSQIDKLYNNLEILTPPGHTQKFDVYLFNKKNKNEYGKIQNEDFKNFDYRVDAKVNSDKTVNIKIHREEFQLSLIDQDLFKRNQMKLPPFDLSTFRNGIFQIDTTIFDLLPQLEGSNKEYVADKIGALDFSFYFMKMNSSRKLKEKFSYKGFSPRQRDEWYKRFGGIRVFRDNFRVRPYGELGSSSFDWLLLGERKAQSPAGVTKKGGGYKVSPNQVAGTVNITRVDNLEFKDKSSREGFQENETFDVLKELLLAIISRFELDRHTVMREMDLFFRDKNENEAAMSDAESMSEDQPEDKNKSKEDYKDERETFKKAYNSIKHDYEDVQEEVKLLRALATTGLLVTSFAHEFETIKNQMERRTNYLKSSLKKLLNEEELNETIESRNNPFKRLENFKKYDNKLKHWLDFSLAAVRKDKRNTKPVNIKSFLSEFKSDWNEVLQTRKVKLNITTTNEKLLEFTVFVIDIESVFNNLLINSFDAFDRKNFIGKRVVDINVDLITDFEDEQDYLVIDYKDSGPGLKNSILNPYAILRAGYTTKLNKDNEPIGTGLGMYIIDSVVEYYSGIIELHKPEQGFAITIKLPYKV
tara:strand:+ start:3154 stop:5697 length:2544 start_codon:yes stop_codon:yes gene_type:complete